MRTKLLDQQKPDDESQVKEWTNQLTNMVGNPIHQAFVKHTGAGVACATLSLENTKGFQEEVATLDLQEVV